MENPRQRAADIVAGAKKGNRMAAGSATRPIAIIGGGPVGMVLAMTLARLGVGSVVVNIETDSRWRPKGSTHNA